MLYKKMIYLFLYFFFSPIHIKPPSPAYSLLNNAVPDGRTSEGIRVHDVSYGDFHGAGPERCIELARYMLEKKTTVRDASRQFGVSKSTVHKDVTVRLRQVSPSLYQEVRQLLDLNKQERHIRGGLATRRKYARRRSEASGQPSEKNAP